MMGLLRKAFKRQRPQKVAAKVFALSTEQQSRYEKGQNITVLVKRGEQTFAIAAGDSMTFYD